MATDKPSRNVRIGPEWTEGEQLARQLAAITGQALSMTEYVRRALVDYNRWARRVVDAVEIPGGDIIITGTETIVGDRSLTPGVYRRAGTTDLITIGDPQEDTTATLED